MQLYILTELDTLEVGVALLQLFLYYKDHILA